MKEISRLVDSHWVVKRKRRIYNQFGEPNYRVSCLLYTVVESEEIEPLLILRFVRARPGRGLSYRTSAQFGTVF